MSIWHRAFLDAGICVPAVEIHRRIGMSGSLMIDALASTHKLHISDAQREALEETHRALYAGVVESIVPLPGAVDLWRRLEDAHLRWAIATSAKKQEADILTRALALPPGAIVVTQVDGAPSKPSPHPFARAAEQLQVELAECAIVGDSVWDILASRRAGAFGIGLLTGGYAREELTAAGAYRVYEDPRVLGERLAELGMEE
ncbi:MAG: HAD family hydrolase [Candidatus Eremiobacteraeota bacterium]|nr:HAD family hydrolase [Candidatus Eremiobacteraeota bacterium]